MTILAIATGHDTANGSLDAFNTYFFQNSEDYEPRVINRVPFGSTSERSLSGKLRVDGSQIVECLIQGCSQSDLNDYITAIFGDWSPSSQSVAVTIRWLDRDNTYTRYNAYADFPIEGDDYEHHLNDQIENLTLRFNIIGIAS